MGYGYLRGWIFRNRSCFLVAAFGVYKPAVALVRRVHVPLVAIGDRHDRAESRLRMPS